MRGKYVVGGNILFDGISSGAKCLNRPVRSFYFKRGTNRFCPMCWSLLFNLIVKKVPKLTVQEAVQVNSKQYNARVRVRASDFSQLAYMCARSVYSRCVKIILDTLSRAHSYSRYSKNADASDLEWHRSPAVPGSFDGFEIRIFLIKLKRFLRMKFFIWGRVPLDGTSRAYEGQNHRHTVYWVIEREKMRGFSEFYPVAHFRNTRNARVHEEIRSNLLAQQQKHQERKLLREPHIYIAHLHTPIDSVILRLNMNIFKFK